MCRGRCRARARASSMRRATRASRRRAVLVELVARSSGGALGVAKSRLVKHVAVLLCAGRGAPVSEAVARVSLHVELLLVGHDLRHGLGPVIGEEEIVDVCAEGGEDGAGNTQLVWITCKTSHRLHLQRCSYIPSCHFFVLRQGHRLHERPPHHRSKIRPQHRTQVENFAPSLQAHRLEAIGRDHVQRGRAAALLTCSGASSSQAHARFHRSRAR